MYMYYDAYHYVIMLSYLNHNITSQTYNVVRQFHVKLMWDVMILDQTKLRIQICIFNNQLSRHSWNASEK